MICSSGVEKVQSFYFKAGCEWSEQGGLCRGVMVFVGTGEMSEVAWSCLASESPSLFGEEHLMFVSCPEWFRRLVLEGALILLIWKKIL